VNNHVEFQVFVAYPPDREGRVVELNIIREGEVDIPAELFRDNGETMITLFSRKDGPAWTYRLADFVLGLDAATAALEAPPRQG
jgi:hypothetical protein